MSFLNTKIHHTLLRLVTGLMIVIMLPLLSSCKHSAPSQKNQHERISLDNLASTYTSVDSLSQLQRKMEREGNTTGNIIVLRHIGNLLRLDNHFPKLCKPTTKAKNALRLSATHWDGYKPQTRSAQTISESAFFAWPYNTTIVP